MNPSSHSLGIDNGQALEPKPFARNPEAWRSVFPILSQSLPGGPLVYLDSAATTQKPQSVLDAIAHYYRFDNANVHRGAHTLADRATQGFEAARDKVANFIASPGREQIIFTKGATEALNLVAYSYGGSVLKARDRILISSLEHHANIVPWQLIAAKTGAEIVPIPLLPSGDLDLAFYAQALAQGAKILALTQVSNALGTVNPIAEMIQQARAAGVTTVIDGSQAVAHLPVDVQALGCDFYVFSGHKLYAPTGIGVLWGRRELLEAMPPWQSGGEMIEQVSFAGTTFNQLPFKFEAGTPHIEGVIGLGAAVDFIRSLDADVLHAHETNLMRYLQTRAQEVPGLQPLANPRCQIGAFSFLLEAAHPSDVGVLLDQQGIAVRTGHHCAQPLMAALRVPGTVRASLALYNQPADIDALIEGLLRVRALLC